MPIVELSIDSTGALTGAKQYDQATTQIASSTEKADTSLSKMREGVNKMGPMIAAAGAAVGTALGAVAIKTIGLASDLEETTNKFNVVFDGMTETANVWAEDLRQNYMMTTEESRRFMASTQDLLKPMGVATEQAGKMSFETAKLAADLGSFNNLTTVEVMDKIQSALVGNYESMKSLGVVMNKTKVEANAYATGIAQVGEELTQAQIAQSALDLIMKGSADAQGDMARSAGSYALQMKQLQTNITELGTQIGTILLPYATQVITMLNDWLLKQGGLNTLLNGSIEIIRGLYNGYQGIVMVLKSVVVAVAKFAEVTIKSFRAVMKPFDLLLSGIEKVGGPKNPFKAATEAVEMFSASAVENLAKTWDKTVSFNQAMDQLKATTTETGTAVQTAAEQTDVIAASMGNATVQGGQLNDVLGEQAETVETMSGTMVELSSAANEAAAGFDNIAASSQVSAGANQELLTLLHGMNSSLDNLVLSQLEAGNTANDAAIKTQIYKQSVDQLGASAGQTAQQVGQLAGAMSAAGAAGAGGVGGGGSGGGGGVMTGTTRLPEWFTEEMIQEYAQFAGKFMTQRSPIKGKFFDPGQSWRESISNARDRYSEQQLDPENWAQRSGYGQSAEARESGGVVVNVNQSMSKSELAALIAELERAQARQ